MKPLDLARSIGHCLESGVMNRTDLRQQELRKQGLRTRAVELLQAAASDGSLTPDQLQAKEFDPLRQAEGFPKLPRAPAGGRGN